MELFNKLIENHERIDAQNAARRAAIEAAYAEENQDLPPTVDWMGRMHAPCDGYVDYETDRIYGKGQFIPLPPDLFDEQDDFFKSYPCGATAHGYKQRVKAHFATLEELKAHAASLKEMGITFGSGKSWEERGVRVCYLYVEARYRSDLAILCEGCKVVIDKAPEVEYQPAPEGRTVVTGEVLAVKIRDGYYGQEVKMLVLSDKMFKVWCTVPSAISGIERGERVQFTVTLKPSDDDKCFAFGSRPSKATVLETADA